MNLTYYRVCRVRCKHCGDVLEYINQTKDSKLGQLMWCSCGKTALDPAALMYRILGDYYEDLSEEWKE